AACFYALPEIWPPPFRSRELPLQPSLSESCPAFLPTGGEPWASGRLESGQLEIVRNYGPRKRVSGMLLRFEPVQIQRDALKESILIGIAALCWLGLGLTLLRITQRKTTPYQPPRTSLLP